MMFNTLLLSNRSTECQPAGLSRRERQINSTRLWWESGAAADDISLDEVRRALSTIRGSLSETVIDERRDR